MIDHVADDPTLLGHRHGTRDRQHHATVVVAGHLQHNLERLAKLAATEGGLRHGPQQVRKGRHLPQVETLQRGQPVPASIVERISLHFLVMPLRFACVVLATGCLPNNLPHAGAKPPPPNELHCIIFWRKSMAAWQNRRQATAPPRSTGHPPEVERLGQLRPLGYALGPVTSTSEPSRTLEIGQVALVRT